ncbi:MAG: peroxiredoxin-like family protein [Leptolyngbyaceae bacterium]|nr:peroxiredoxin-like family protein [Leptolyngbyaceae bacterium]
MNPASDAYAILSQTHRQRVSDGAIAPLFSSCQPNVRKLVLVLPQLGDFDSLEYAWWLNRESDKIAELGLSLCAIGIGDRPSGQQFCDFTGFPADALFIDPTAELHRQLGLYEGLTWSIPGLSPGQSAWVNLMLMCAGIGSPGTLAEVFRGYRGDRQAPQLIADDEAVKATPLPRLKGSFFQWAGGKGFQRPFELATLRLRNMAEVLGHWNTYVPDARYMTQRGATFVFDATGEMVYEHCDRGILGFAENMSRPLSFLDSLRSTVSV